MLVSNDDKYEQSIKLFKILFHNIKIKTLTASAKWKIINNQEWHNWWEIVVISLKWMKIKPETEIRPASENESSGS